jgi:DNA polymerase-3 subunit chi
MTDIRFYHLTRSRLEDALPVMLLRTLQRDARAVVRFADAQRLGDLDEWLWTFDDAEFIPHGHAVGEPSPPAEAEAEGTDPVPGDETETGAGALQPVWLTLGLDNPGGAGYLFITDGAPADGLEGFEVCSILFDGRVEASVQAARERWAAIKAMEGEHSLSYWQQNQRGGWEKRQ